MSRAFEYMVYKVNGCSFTVGSGYSYNFHPTGWEAIIRIGQGCNQEMKNVFKFLPHGSYYTFYDFQTLLLYNVLMIKNVTKNTVLSQSFKEKKGMEKTLGLIGKKSAETLFFKTRFGIHTFFVKFPIGLIVLDKNNKVVYINKKIKPNRIVFWNLRYDKVIELSPEALEKSKTGLGDLLKFL
jgi:uncharacterized protein